MADPPRSPAAGGGGAGPDRAATTGTPRWVKVSAIIAAVVIVLFVLLLVIKGPGGHGPRRHFSLGGQAAPTSILQAQAPPRSGRA